MIEATAIKQPLPENRQIKSEVKKGETKSGLKEKATGLLKKVRDMLPSWRKEVKAGQPDKVIEDVAHIDDLTIPPTDSKLREEQNRDQKNEKTIVNSAEAETKKRDETVIRLLRSVEDDADFQKNIPAIMENAPQAVQTVNEDFKATRGIERDKFGHTQDTLQILQTTGLSEPDRFIARAAMMLHDCDPSKVISDMSRWIKSGLISNDEAVSIMKQVWWHDLLGVDVNKGLHHTAEITQVITDSAERAINIKIFEADTASYGLETYKGVLEQVPNLQNTQDTTIDLEDAKQRGLLEGQQSLQPPGSTDIFVHGIYLRDNQNSIGELTSKVLLNMLASNTLKSTSRLTNLENFKVTSTALGGKATDKELNMFRFQPGKYPSEISSFGQSDNNWLKIVYLGKDIQNDCMVKPLTTAENTDYVAGLVNRFDSKGDNVGAEMPLDKAYFVVSAEAAPKLIPLLKLQALRINQDPDHWIMQRVVIDDKSKSGQLLSQLSTGELNIEDHNTQKLVESLKYNGYSYEGDLNNHFNSVVLDGSSGVSNPDLFKCQIVDSSNMAMQGLEKRLNDLVAALPSLAEHPQIQALRQRIAKDDEVRNNLIKQVEENKGVFFDQQQSILYIEGQSNGAIAAISNVQSFTGEVENEGNEFAMKKAWNIKLKDGKTLSIKKGSFQLD